ncbi:hypothetical protein E4P41_20460 [Geodermatophilus sp. DF01-2]|uniref:hypothetical protein n=1 Tax=Geodermatophilus sp. DF01-2 TaxID=2559610 RepID=UPI0010737D9E|nr:hypothetical protein [Geodermatophilus sp. DF01_2]TFV53936.1 hypothetical protein E4P41_20460 [Geodermatophilus sp. DF01_2]
MTDLRLVVGGLLTRDAVLGTLLLNYAAGLGCVCPEEGDTAVRSFIVPDWVVDSRASAPASSRLFTVEAHVRRDVPLPRRRLDTVLDRVDAVLTGAAGDESFSTRRLGGTDVLGIGVGTVSKTATWELTPAAAGIPGAAPAAGAYRDARPRSGAASSSR